MTTRNIPRQAPNTSSVHSVGQSLFNQLLEIGEKLLHTDSELYKTAVAHLHEHIPREPSPVRRAAGAEQKGVQGDHPRRSSTTFHKYVLPGDAGKREYYQCMVCSERRTTNSFHADHQHEGQKLTIRWYCPLCDTLYAVTHRGYHIKNRHKSAETRKKSSGGRGSTKNNSNSSEDYTDDDGEEEEEESPRRHGKKRMREDDETSQGSEDASASVLANISKPPPPTSPSQMTLIHGATPATVTPQMPVADQPLSNNDTVPMPITHTVTQEALLGGASLMPSESVFRLADSASTTNLVSTSTESKLLFSGAGATITRQ